MTEKRARQKFTGEMIKTSYSAAKRFYDGKIDRQEGIRQMMAYNINPGSAKIILDGIICQMMDGKEFTRTLSVAAFSYYLKKILEDYRVQQLIITLEALRKHIAYIATQKDPKIQLKKVYAYYLKLVKEGLDTEVLDEMEQEEIEDYIAGKQMTKAEAAKELKKLNQAEDETVVVNGIVYKRNNKAIALIKRIRDFSCQICHMSIRKKNGKNYVEAAHIIPKHQKGKETPDNILILCSNHHKEFDHGDLKINLPRNKERIDFIMNGVNYSLESKAE